MHQADVRRGATAPRSDERRGVDPGRRAHVQGTSVMRTLRPGQHGTVRWTKRHGTALVCVRYRQDALRVYRFTTVEVVVDAAPVHPRRFDRATFGVRVHRHEAALRARLRATGARWDPEEQLWWARGCVVRELDLVHRIRRI